LIANSLRGRIGKQCRERWHNHLNPDVRKDAWSQEEDALIFDLVEQHGTKWATIAKTLEGRTDNAIKNRYYSSLKKHHEQRRQSLGQSTTSMILGPTHRRRDSGDSDDFHAFSLSRHGFSNDTVSESSSDDAFHQSEDVVERSPQSLRADCHNFGHLFTVGEMSFIPAQISLPVSRGTFNGKASPCQRRLQPLHKVHRSALMHRSLLSQFAHSEPSPMAQSSSEETSEWSPDQIPESVPANVSSEVPEVRATPTGNFFLQELEPLSLVSEYHTLFQF